MKLREKQNNDLNQRSWFSLEWQWTDSEEKKLVNKVAIIVFFAHKKYFVASLRSMQGQKALVLVFHQTYINLCSEDERRSYWFGLT